MADDITELVRLLREKPDITSHCAASCIEGFQRKAAKVSPDPVVVRLERENEELRAEAELLSAAWRAIDRANESLRERLAAAEDVMKAVASLPGRLWLTGQLALAEFLSGEDGEHLKYALEQYEQHDAAKVSGKKIADHEFQPSVNYPPGDGCSHIVCGHDWTIADPVRCRKPEAEHERSARDEAAKGGRDEPA